MESTRTDVLEAQIEDRVPVKEVKGKNKFTVKNEYLDPDFIYKFIQALRAFVGGVFGLGNFNFLSSYNSAIAAIIIEGVCSLIALLILIPEFINVVASRCSGSSHEDDEGQSFIGGYSVYLTMRLLLFFLSVAGIALIATDLPSTLNTNNSTEANNSTGSPKQQAGTRANIGSILITLSIFGSRLIDERPRRALNNNAKKIENDEEIELQEKSPKKTRK